MGFGVVCRERGSRPRNYISSSFPAKLKKKMFSCLNPWPVLDRAQIHCSEIVCLNGFAVWDVIATRQGLATACAAQHEGGAVVVPRIWKAKIFQLLEHRFGGALH